jgi:hypothetical protein
VHPVTVTREMGTIVGILVQNNNRDSRIGLVKVKKWIFELISSLSIPEKKARKCFEDS